MFNCIKEIKCKYRYIYGSRIGILMMTLACLCVYSFAYGTPDLGTTPPVNGIDPEFTWSHLFERVFESILVHWHQYILSISILIFTFIFRGMFVRWISKHFSAWASDDELDALTIKALQRPLNFAFALLGMWGANLTLGCTLADVAPVIQGYTAEFLHKLLSLLWFIVLGWSGWNFCDVISHLLAKMAEQTDTRMDDMLVPMIRKALKVIIVMITIILLIQNWGYSISALLAGFSIGGVAVALASQDMLQNLFGSIMIFVDRPFQVGDWITVGEIEGVVEEVGMRSTRIRTFAETLITVPNHKIAHEPINNYSRMPRRRVKQVIGVGYDTEPERLEATVQSMRTILRDHPEVDQSFWMVTFQDFGDSALNILVYYFTKTTNWVNFMQIKQDISIEFMKALNELGVEIAFPTRTLYLRQDEVDEKPPLEDVVHIYSPRSDAPPPPIDAGVDEGG